MAKITPEELDAGWVAALEVDLAVLGWARAVAELLSDPAIQRLVVTKCVEAASGEGDVPLPTGYIGAWDLIDAICPEPETTP